jgi:hypothetical protein
MLAGYLQLYRDLTEPLKALAAMTPVRWAFSALIALEYEAAEPLYKMYEAIGFDEAIEIAPSILLSSVVILLGATYARLATTSSSTGS